VRSRTDEQEQPRAHRLRTRPVCRAVPLPVAARTSSTPSPSSDTAPTCPSPTCVTGPSTTSPACPASTRPVHRRRKRPAPRPPTAHHTAPAFAAAGYVAEQQGDRERAGSVTALGDLRRPRRGALPRHALAAQAILQGSRQLLRCTRRTSAIAPPGPSPATARPAMPQCLKMFDGGVTTGGGWSAVCHG
jgi:hypothetical protein